MVRKKTFSQKVEVIAGGLFKGIYYFLITFYATVGFLESSLILGAFTEDAIGYVRLVFLGVKVSFIVLGIILLIWVIAKIKNSKDNQNEDI